MDPSKTDVVVGTATKQWDKKNTTIVAASNSKTQQTFYAGNPPKQNDNELTDVNIRHSIDFGKTRVQVGGDYLHWHSPTGQNYYEGIEREEKIKSLFVQGEHKMLNDRLSVDGAIRRDRVDVIKGLDYFTGGAQPPKPTPLVSGRTLPAAKFESLGTSYALNDNWKVTGRLGWNEQDDSNLNPVPGVTLKPEKQNKWELGLEGDVSPRFVPTLTAFERKTENEKALLGYTYTRNNGTTATCSTGTIPASGPTAANASGLQPCYTQSDTTKQGIELAVKGNFAERSNYKAGITHMTKLTNTDGTLGQTTPKDVVDLSVNHGVGLYTVGAAAKHVSSYQSSGVQIGGYNRYDLSLSRDFHLHDKPVKATLYGKNVTNKKYQTTASVEDVGAVYGVEFLMDF
jgi:iron complex outermembrane receptor protein